MKYAILLSAIFLLLAVPALVVSQEPVLDLAITNLTYTDLPGDEALFEAEVRLATADSIDLLLTDVRFYLDGLPAGVVAYDVTPTPISPCQETEPACDGYCLPAEINGQLVNGFCWSLTYGDPPEQNCVCAYLVIKPHVEPAPGEPDYLTATVDEDGVIAKTDETNNSMTIFVGPTDNSGPTWSGIKSLYR